jgi:RHS repeat-associated protein
MLKISKPRMRIYSQRSLLFLIVGLIGFAAVQPAEVFALFNFAHPATAQRGTVAPLKTEANNPKASPTLQDLAGSSKSAKKDTSTSRERVRELTDKRSAFTKTYLNKDGTKTLEYTPEEQNYKDGAEWKSIDNTLSNVGGSKSLKGKAGKISATLKPLADGISVTADGKTITVKPVGARDVVPVKNGRNSVIYKDAWPNVDVEYELRGQMVKEIIIVKGKTSRTSFNFSVTGGKVINHPTVKGALTIEGMPSDYQFSPLSLDVHGHGVISEQRVFQTATANGIAVNLDKDWFNAQDNSAFPMRIDPTFTKQSQISYQMYKSDGYSCGASNCYANTGSINDGTGWKSWRSYINIPYTELQNKTVLNADIHGWFKSGIGGSTTSRAIAMGLANCLGFNCIGTTVGTDSTVSTDFDIDFTAKLKALVDADDYSSWWSIRGVESSSTLTYKPYYDMRATITYDTPTPMSAAASPGDKAMVVSTQPSLRVNNVTDADGDAVQYYFRVSTNPDAETGAVINSGWITSSQWTVPDNILQDGRTYYWHVYTRGYAQTNPTWVRSFKVDMRTGKDSTQAYETVGPLNVDLATGNATTGTGSHSISALGGDIDVSLNYNSPAMSRPGLVGQYWNNNSWSGTPNAERVDPDVDFAWTTGSPSGAVSTDNFTSRWTGYITAPTTGDYFFGCSVDDRCYVYINDQLVMSRTTPGLSYGTSSVHLDAGKPASIKVEYLEGSSTATMQLKVKGAVAEQTVPSAWFNTGARPTATKYGLEGRYYKDDGTKTFPSNLNDPSRLLMVRNDTKLNFNWGAGAASPGLPSDNYLARWRGYLTVPEDGTYTLGASGDDGIRLKLGTGAFGADQTIYDGWSYVAGDRWGTAVTLSKNQTVPITIEYYEAAGNANFKLSMKGPGLSDQGEDMPVTWLAPNANILPDGWDLGYGDGGVNYERLQISSNAAILSDSTGQTYEYTWKNDAYEAPKNQEATLTKNDDDTYTVIDTDGKTYIFDAEGKLVSVSSPEDDKQPAALKYEYAGNPSHLSKIIDGVTPERYGQLYYAGDSECETSAGFDAAPAGMLCAFKTTDGKKTLFQYKLNNLSRIVQPGDDYEDYGYDEFGRIVSYRDTVANDAIAYGVRDDNNEVNTEITYDGLGRVRSIKAPAPTAGANRNETTFDYFSNSTEMHVAGAAEPNGFSKKVTYDSLFRTTAQTDVTNKTTSIHWDTDKDLVRSTTGPTGLKSTTVYNNDDLPTDSYGPAPAEWFDETTDEPLPDKVNAIPHVKTGYDEGISSLAVSYMSVKERESSVLTSGATLYKGDIIRSPDQRFYLIYQTDGNVVLRGPTGAAIWNNHKAGVASTRLIMQADGNLVLYNGSTPVWSTETNGHSGSYLQVQNDGNLVIYTNYTGTYSWNTETGGQAKDSWNSNSLLGAPLLNGTGLGSDPAKLNGSWSSSPVNSGTNYWGLRMTGKMYLPTTGNWNFRMVSDGGARMYIDDQLVWSDWWDGKSRSHPTYTFNNTKANSPHKIMIEYYHLGGASANFALYMTPPGGSETASVTQYLKPDYNLTTSSTVYDSQLGDMTSTVNYSDPAYGLVSGAALDPTGLNLQSSATYEAEGAGFLRQTSKTLSGGETTQYQYYSATDTRDNPCTPETESINQAGLTKGKTDPDPDGNGPATPITTETIYDKSGQVAAVRTNNDPWTCTTFDERGRPLTTTTPGFDSKAGRTITNNYLVDSTPLKATTSDTSGTITTEVDLLGRMVMYEDAKGNITYYSYDSKGRLASRVSPIGNETYDYDQYNRLTTYKLDSVTYATVHYDSDNRISSVDYPAGMSLTSIGHDDLQRANEVTYHVGDTTLSDEVTRSTSGNVLSGTQNGVAKSYSYDGAGRLTGATIGGNTFGYEFGTPDASCGGIAGNNANAGKSGNRTKYTLNGQSTTYCYDMADRLLASSDSKYTNAQYDSHGNTISLGDATHTTNFGYDANDRNMSISETYTGKTEKVVTYDRDVSDRLLHRNYKIDGNTESDTFYGYTASGDSPNFVTDGAGTVVQKYLSLPGGVSVTIKPQSSSAGAVTYSLSNLHGDTMATVNADGLATVQAPTGPFGEILPTSGIPSNTVDGASFAYVGAYKKTTDTDFAIAPTQMGARVYVAELGRFLQVDPVEGGTDNSYAYVNDPVNDFDLNGQWGFGDVFNWAKSVVKNVIKTVVKTARTVVATVKKVVKAVVKTVTAVVYPVIRWASAPLKPKAPAKVTNQRTKASVAKATSTRAAKPKKLGDNYSLQLDQLMVNNIPKGTGPSPKLHPWKATTTALDFAAGFSLAGTVLGCAVGAIGISLVASPAAAPVGCGGGGEAGSLAGGAVGLMVGAFLGLHNSPGSDLFDWGPDQVYNPWA